MVKAAQTRIMQLWVSQDIERKVGMICQDMKVRSKKAELLLSCDLTTIVVLTEKRYENNCGLDGIDMTMHLVCFVS